MDAENENQDLTTEDVEGHRIDVDPAKAAPVEGLVKDDVDDVSGHVQPRRDLDIER